MRMSAKLPSYRRIDEPLWRAAQAAPAHPALVDGAQSLHYRELADWALATRDQLVARGLVEGDRVALFLEKTPEIVAGFYGIWAAGGIAVPIHPGSRPRQVSHIITHSDSRFIITDDRRLGAIGAEALAGRTVVEIEPPALSAATLPQHDDAFATERAAVLLYTSGSTGLPKGVTVSHANLLAGARIVVSYLGITAAERILSVLPFNFDYGLNQLLTSVDQMATLVLHRSPLPGDVCRALVKHEITGLAGVPPLWLQLLDDNSPLSKLEYPKLRYITNSGGVFPVDAVRRYRTIMPHTKIFLMYGLTEAFRSTYLPSEEVDRRPESMGKAIPECEMLVISGDGRLCEPGEVGELVHRGPTIAIGYWRDEEATTARFRPDPFRPGERVVYSGDQVKRDAEGFLYFVGRTDEMIKSFGHRISPTEVESAIYESGLVSGVVVKGVPHPIGGKVLVAHCVPSEPASFTVERLLAFCKQELPNHLVPSSIVVHESFPRTVSGKFDRKAIGA